VSATHAPTSRPDAIAAIAPWHERFPCFDGLRAMAALAVVITHVSFATGSNTSTLVGYVFDHLDVGVSVFFVLSGFLLYRPFVAAHLSARPGPSLRRYATRRFLRIYPAYWIALTFFLFGARTIHFHNAGDYVAFYALVHIYWRQRVLGGIVATWSLAVEVSFYVFLPVYALVMSRWAGQQRRTARAEATGVAVLYVAGLTFHALALLILTHPAPATLWLPCQIDLFALGMGLAVASAWAAQTGAVPRVLAAAGRHPAWCWLAAAVAFTLAATALHLPRTFGDLPKRGEMGRQILYGLTALFLVLPAVFGRQEHGAIRRSLRSRPAELLGLISYGIFLWHSDWVKKLVEWGGLGWISQARFASVLVLTLALTLPCAALSYVVIERPLIRLSHRRSAPAGQPQPAAGNPA